MIIVTMTSWKGRIDNVVRILDTLVENTKRPDKIEINLSLEEFPTSEYRCIGMIQIPIGVIHEEVNPQNGHIHCTFAYKKVIFNAINVEYDMEIFWKIFEHNKQVIKDYIEKSLKEQLVGIIKPQHPEYTFNDVINDLTKEMQDEIDKEIIKDIIEKLKNDSSTTH